MMLSFLSTMYLLIVLLLFFKLTISCKDYSDPQNGNMFNDFTLKVGLPLVLTCQLYDESVIIRNEKYYANASYLMFQKGRQNVDEKNIKVINPLKSELTINSSKIEDSGIYNCILSLPNNKNITVCSTHVNVGYEPQPVRNFTCISKNLRELKCEWWNVPNIINTTSSIHCRKDEFGFITETICPKFETYGNDHWSCEWSLGSYPAYEYTATIMTFVINTSNVFGTHNDTFRIDHYSIVLPDKPHLLTVNDLKSTEVKLMWSAPIDIKIFPPGFFYHIEYKAQSARTWTVINITSLEKKISYKIINLFPNMVYEFIIRCRTNFQVDKLLWSENASYTFKTLSDIPYFPPEVTREAFEVENYQISRAILLRWKHVSEDNHNGDGFYYSISYFPTYIKRKKKEIPSSLTVFANVTAPYIQFSNLDLNTAYFFKIFSANKIGLSKKYSSILVDKSSKLPSVPENVVVISQSDFYEISWKHSSKTSFPIINYTVFYCPNLQPRPYSCKGDINWKHVENMKTQIKLRIPNEKTNFQFAVSANSENSSSGMEWASCVIPSNGTVDRLREIFTTPTSFSIQIVWKLDCNAQRRVIKEFHILYCKIKFENNFCEGNFEQKVVNNSAENYTITHLTPFTNYRVSIKIVLLNGIKNTDDRIVETLPAAPAGPPENIDIIKITNTSIDISWESPIFPNGIISNYIIQYNIFSERIEVKNNEIKKHNITLKNNIMAYTNYTIKMKVCVKEIMCSVWSNPIYIQTEIGVPEMMKPLQLGIINGSHVKVMWNPPSKPNGPINYYLLHLYSKQILNTSTGGILYNKTINISGIETSTLVNINCPSEFEEGIKYFFQMQPINKINDIILIGPKNQPTEGKLCSYSEKGLSSKMMIGIVIGGAIGCILLLIVVYIFIRWMKKKLDDVRKIKIRLPTGLDSPDRGSLGTYENFKKGLKHDSIPPIKPRPGSFILDNSESRHNSECSHYSNISPEEEYLLNKSGRCDIYRRNPSGDSSSGCSSNGVHNSISSTNTNQIHLSTDSGAEMDFLSLSPTDNVFSEKNCVLMSKMNEQDVSDNVKENSSTKLKFKEEQILKGHDNSASINSSPLVQYPYSKFGVNQNKHSHYYKQLNILAYTANLSNSEPNIVDLDNEKPLNFDHLLSILPYSKLSFSKSLEYLTIRQSPNILEHSANCAVADIEQHNNLTLSPQYSTVGFSNRTENNFYPVNKGYITIESCLEKCNKISCMKDRDFAVIKNDDCDNMAYSKFDIRPSAVVVPDLKVNSKEGYIPFEQVNFMLQMSDLSNINRSPSENNIHLSDDLATQNATENLLNSSSDILNSVHNTDCLTNEIPVICSYDQNNSNGIEKFDFNLIRDISPETSDHNIDTDNENISTQQLEVVISPKNLCATENVPTYRFHSHDNRKSTNATNGYIHLSPISYV